jgi:hypothetical protein
VSIKADPSRMSTLLLSADDSGRVVGKPEVILGHDSFGGQIVISPFHIASDYRKLINHPSPGRALRTASDGNLMLRLQVPDHSGERVCPIIFREKN